MSKLIRTFNRRPFTHPLVVNGVEATLFEYDYYDDDTCPECERDSDCCTCDVPMPKRGYLFGWCTEDGEDHLGYETYAAAMASAQADLLAFTEDHSEPENLSVIDLMHDSMAAQATIGKVTTYEVVYGYGDVLSFTRLDYAELFARENEGDIITHAAEEVK